MSIASIVDMIRIFPAFFAIGLVALWLAGLFTSTAPEWLTWTHAAAAVWSAAIAADLASLFQVTFLALLLVGACLIAGFTNAPAWQTWLTLVLATGFVALSIAVDVIRRRQLQSQPDQAQPPHEEPEKSKIA